MHYRGEKDKLHNKTKNKTVLYFWASRKSSGISTEWPNKTGTKQDDGKFL